LVLAGAIGVSPWLHWLVEHDGHGTAHSHVGQVEFEGATVAAEARWRAHSQGGGHVHHHHHHFEAEGHFRLPSDDSRLSGGLAQGSNEKDDAGSEPEHSDPAHHHDSLPQWLISGLLEQCGYAPALPPFSAASAYLSPATFAILPDAAWDLQTASRGPPFPQC
jgi:hypothetical protein